VPVTAAWGLMRSKSGLGAYLPKQRSRLGTPKAITATAQNLAWIVDHLIRFGGDYVKTTEAKYDEQVRLRLETQLRRWAAELGFDLTRRAARE
jgi:hypothetical protein